MAQASIPFVCANNAHYETRVPTSQPDVLVKSGSCREPNTWAFTYVNGEGKLVPHMPTSKECRLHAEECLQLAKQAEEFYVKTALIELAEDFKQQAEKNKSGE
jgi:hypothetical protein